jgi:hypothetical protein|tara:strand:- start:40278 stop:40823 length:546 start_codon:yes stop_codon:yes gene_type:complete
MELRKFIGTTIREYLSEQQSIVKSRDIVQFTQDKAFINPKSKMFLYHGTSVSPSEFTLRDDYNFEDSNAWSGDLPEGYLFLTTDINEAVAYGQYVIPCELRKNDHVSFDVNSNNPSKAFDMDYGIDLEMPEKYHNLWGKFEDSMKNSLIIKGYNNKWTIITDINNVIPRTDLAVEFYSQET